ncbi:MAG: dioxygenase [Chitinophagaceae bacterium]|nr:MAG: dioxygenase [Chitinophagaceae bacterium]
MDSRGYQALPHLRLTENCLHKATDIEITRWVPHFPPRRNCPGSSGQRANQHFPKTIHDFGGFPQDLFDVQYPAPGNKILAKETAEIIKSAKVELDHDWGLDHGTWTVVRHMYPGATIPVLQLSIDYSKSPQYHYDLGKELYELRKKGVLIIGSGNMVHNLRMVAWDKMNTDNYGFDWAIEMNNNFKNLIGGGNHQPLINYESFGTAGKLAIPTPEHYLPLLYTLALQNKKESASFFNDKAVAGSLTMTSVKIG